jgi:hypothetical protein
MSRRVGEVLAVKGPHVTIEVDRHISDLHIRHGGKTYSVGQPGSYLSIGRGHDRHLLLVTQVYKSRLAEMEDNEQVRTPEDVDIGLPKGRFPYLPGHVDLTDRTLIAGVLIGTISGQSFEVGVTQLPVVGDTATLTLERDIEIALKPAKDKHTISIGTFADSSIQVHLDIDELFGKHCAIVGTTGCGKSYTVAKMLQCIASDYPAANILVFDLHGEYQRCFDKVNYVRADQLSMPVWIHPFESLFDLCVDLSNQYNIHNQRWAFREGIFRLKQKFCREVLKDEGLANNLDLDAPIPFSVDHLGCWLTNQNRATTDYDNDRIVTYRDGQESKCTEEGSFDWFSKEWEFKPTEQKKIKRGPFYGDLDRLVVRFNSRRKDPRYAFMFKYGAPAKGDIEKLVSQMSGFVSKGPKPIMVFDMSYLPSETVGMVVAAVSRILFQVYFLSERGKYAPTLLVYEEAHNYIAKVGRGAYGDARDAVERIAKEGRKFGLGVVVVSQRPSELSETLLSQCNTFVCMRLANAVDKRYIVGLLPDSMSEMVDILPVLPRGHALCVGQASKLPVRMRVTEIEDSERRPYSDDPPFGRMWKKDIGGRESPDICSVCDNWIRSKRPGRKEK